jgi:hypothetical protein
LAEVGCFQQHAAGKQRPLHFEGNAFRFPPIRFRFAQACTRCLATRSVDSCGICLLRRCIRGALRQGRMSRSGVPMKQSLRVPSSTFGAVQSRVPHGLRG